MFKKWKLLRVYIKTLKKHTQDIRNHFIENSQNFSYQILDMKYDRAYRFYTILNLPPNTTENIQKYGYRYLDNETQKFIKELNTQFKKYGLLELVGISKADQISESCIHIIIEYKLLKTTKIARNILLFLLLLASVSTYFIIY